MFRRGIFRLAALKLTGQGLTCDALYKAAHDPKTLVAIDEANWPKIEECRKLVEKWAKEDTIIYGVNTSCGGLVNHLLPQERDNEFQMNLIRSVATQVGDFLPDEIVRMAMIARVNALCRGFSGIKRKNLEIYLQMINKGVHPCIPDIGSLGTSGDLGPLACIALVGVGEWKARFKGKLMSGKEAMDAAGIPLMYLNAKEGLSLINGTSVMVALACESIMKAKNLVFNHDVISALTCEVLLARIDPFNPIVHEKKYHPGQFATAINMFNLFKGSQLMIDDKKHSNTLQKNLHDNQGQITVVDIPMEDGYSLRCIPQFIGPIRETVAFSQTVVEREINSSNDNPLIFTETNTYFHNGHFHGQYMSTVMDMIAMTCANVALIVDRRIDRMFVKSRSVGLPPFLTVEGAGVNSGLMGGQYMTAHVVAENRTMLGPASCQSISTTDGFQDVVSFGIIAGKKALKIIKNSEYTLGFEAMAAAQAATIRGPHLLSPAGKALYEAIREDTVFQKGKNIVFMDDMERLKVRVTEGDFVKRVEKESGPLMWMHQA